MHFITGGSSSSAAAELLQLAHRSQQREAAAAAVAAVSSAAAGEPLTDSCRLKPFLKFRQEPHKFIKFENYSLKKNPKRISGQTVKQRCYLTCSINIFFILFFQLSFLFFCLYRTEYSMILFVCMSFSP